MQDKTVIILRGVSGAGKSTYIKENFADATVVSADKYFMKEGKYCWDASKHDAAHGQCRAMFKQALVKAKPLVVVDNTNTKLSEFKSYLSVAEDFGYTVQVVRLDVPVDTLYGRNVHGVPDATVKDMYDRMQPYEGEKVVTGG